MAAVGGGIPMGGTPNQHGMPPMWHMYNGWPGGMQMNAFGAGGMDQMNAFGAGGSPLPYVLITSHVCRHHTLPD